MTLANGADVNAKNRFNGTELIPASEHAHTEAVRMCSSPRASTSTT